jgi:Asp/Glu/hydantoin racemase
MAQALTLAERFGVIALASASIRRRALALRQMGTKARIAAGIAMNLDMDTRRDPGAILEAMQRTARAFVSQGAQTVMLGYAGMAHHRAAVKDMVGVPVVQPWQAAAGVAMATLRAGAPPAHFR